jgi:uncharacterized protein (TIGR01777 family)
MVIAGASGVVGRHLVAEALRRGWTVRALTRNASGPSRLPSEVERIEWMPSRSATGDESTTGPVSAALEGADLLVNLAGASIADGRLNAKLKQRLLQSRLDATHTLNRAHGACQTPPSCWMQASATGFYGDTADDDVTIDTPPGELFLSGLCKAWEEAVTAAARVVILRIGLVLATDAPLWPKLVKPVRFGVGGRLGSGKQWWAWIDATDLARAVLFLYENESCRGPYNLTAPEPVRQIELTRAIAARLRRPSFLPAPKFALRMVLGAGADELVLPSCKALPTRLLAAGFRFEQPSLDAEIENLLPHNG